MSENNTISESEFEKLLGKILKITGNHIKQRAITIDESEGQHEVLPENIKPIKCDHIEITGFEILEQDE
jgi:hypothetical protein